MFNFNLLNKKFMMMLCWGFISLFVNPMMANEERQDEAAALKFLLNNKTQLTQLPKSFYIPEGYWKAVGSQVDDEENRNERILATYGQNIYDGATWQIALAMMGETAIADQQTQRLLAGKSGNIVLRASSKDFHYGDKKVLMSEDSALFFRMIADEWAQIDPLTGETVGWMDWKPILGESAWAALIGPLQVAYTKYNGQVPLNADEVKLALSILPALKAMQSPIGAIYHSTWGVWGKNPHDISTENNASLYAGLQMLKQVLERAGDSKRIVSSEIDPLLQGIENYFREYGYSPEQGLIVQGGLYNDPAHPNQFVPASEFAVDVQTWGITVIGAEKLDAWFGRGTAYRIWQNTKKRGGYYEQGVLKGVGYTDDPSAVLSVEWTLGAILLTRELNALYHLPELEEEARTMREGVEFLKETVLLEGEETIAFDYANKRYYIPFGWWANKVPSLTSTAWVLMVDRHFNPFVLGGR
jgi:hypothetical protein